MKWYEDTDIRIDFDHIPNVTIREILPSMDESHKQGIKKFPFINKSDLQVIIYDYRDIITKRYMFTISKGYRWDGATIIKPLWSLIGISNTSPEMLIPSMVHDVLCENHNYINYDRYLSSLIFDALLQVSNVPKWKQFMMFHCVDNYQKFLW